MTSIELNFVLLEFDVSDWIDLLYTTELSFIEEERSRRGAKGALS